MFAYRLDSPAILQRIFQDSRVSNDSPALIPALLCTRTPLSCEREGYQFLHRTPAYNHPHDTHQLITLLFHCISLNKHSCVIPVVFWLSLWHSSNQMTQQQAFDPKDGSQATAHICPDLPWCSVVRPTICTKGNTKHSTYDYVTTHTHTHTHKLTDMCLSSWNIQHHWSGFLHWELRTALWPHNDLEMNVCLCKTYNVPNIPSLTH